MIIFLFGTWGSGKSYIGDLLENHCGLPHLEADMHLTIDLVEALRLKLFHEAELEPFYRRVIAEMASYQRRFGDFVVSQGIYFDVYRRMIYDDFAPDIHFALVSTPNPAEQQARLSQRSGGGNPITIDVYRHMEQYWELPTIPYTLLDNDYTLKYTLPPLLKRLGLCNSMETEDWAKALYK